MSDYNSSLPIRTENNGDAAVKIVDGTLTTQVLTVNADGSVNITDNGSSLTVDATNLDIRDLAFATDKVDVSGSSVDVSATDLDIRDLVFATDKVDVSGSTVEVTQGTDPWVVAATDLDIRDLSHTQDSVKIGDGTDFLAVEADGSVTVRLKDASGNPFTGTNPLPVTITVDQAGDEINDYNTAASVAAAGTSNHDYTVSGGKTLLLTSVNAAASGKCKIEVQIESAAGSGIFATKFVQFNSTASPNMVIELKAPIAVVSGAKVRVIRTNKDNQSQDLYSTISGQEI